MKYLLHVPLYQITSSVQKVRKSYDIVVIRHPEIGSAQVAADWSKKPIINAGDGIGEHPTQALLDMFTIMNHFDSPTGLNITLGGDLKNGRTIHSFATLLALYSPLRINLVSPESLRLPTSVYQMLVDQEVETHEYRELDETLEDSDALYMTRIQKERFEKVNEYEELKDSYIITPKTMERMQKHAVLMHPLPRVGEITLEVDQDERALYINEQMLNGMYVRMALLALVLGESL